MGSLGIGHWLIVLLIVALLFGTRRLRSVGEDLGSAWKGFQKGIRGATSDTTTPRADDARGPK